MINEIDKIIYLISINCKTVTYKNEIKKSKY